jgi:hypothetical protein
MEPQKIASTSAVIWFLLAFFVLIFSLYPDPRELYSNFLARPHAFTSELSVMSFAVGIVAIPFISVLNMFSSVALALFIKESDVKRDRILLKSILWGLIMPPTFFVLVAILAAIFL